MTAKQLNDFIALWMALKNSQAGGDHKPVRIIIDALAKAHVISAGYPAR